MEQLNRDKALIVSEKHRRNAKERDQQLEETRKQLKIKLQEIESLNKQVAELNEQLNVQKKENKQHKKELEDMKQQLNQETKTIVDTRKAMDEMKEQQQLKKIRRSRKDIKDIKDNVMDHIMKNSNSPKQFMRRKNVRLLSSPEKTMPPKKKQQREITSYFSTSGSSAIASQ